jgi:uroporphyrinogen decarboxylase
MDRIAAAPILGYPGVRAKGLDAQKCLIDPRLHADVIEYNQRHFGTDAALPLLDLTVEAEGFGMSPLFGETDAPSMRSHQNLSESLLAAGAPTPPRMSNMTEAARLMSREITDVPKGFFITGPFTIAGQIIGLTELLRGVVRQRPEIVDLLENCTKTSIAYAKALDATGIDFLVMAEPTSSLISLAQFENYSKKYIARVRESVSRGIILHICGRSGHLLQAMSETGVAGVSLDQNVAMSDAVKAIPEDMLILGNYPPMNILFENPDQIKANVLDMLSPVGDASNVVASTGCDIPAMASAENIEAFVYATKTFTRP